MEQGFFASKEVMDHALVDPGTVGYVAQRTAREAKFAEKAFYRVQDAFARVALAPSALRLLYRSCHVVWIDLRTHSLAVVPLTEGGMRVSAVMGLSPA
ncbi:hypothetical protein WJ968_09100 [Achromobacter xylosoxidans]